MYRETYAPPISVVLVFGLIFLYYGARFAFRTVERNSTAPVGHLHRLSSCGFPLLVLAKA